MPLGAAFSYIRHAVQENLIGDLLSVHVRVLGSHLDCGHAV